MKVLAQDYTVEYKVANSNYGKITVPKGIPVTHQTACGFDPNYNFVSDLSWVPLVNGIKQYGLIHDLKYYGLNVPKEYITEKL
jgi:hypothetical protein